MISRIKYFMEHYSVLRSIVPLCRKIGLVHLLHILKGNIDRLKNREEREKFRIFCNSHVEEFQKLSNMLEDDFSRETLRNILKFRENWKVRFLKSIIVEPQYFQETIFGPVNDEVFIDGGGYVGDTVEKITAIFGKGHNYCKKIFVWEPDSTNLRQLRKNLKDYKNLEIITCGMWRERTELCFSGGGGSGSKIVENGQQRIQVDSIDNICGGEKVTFIKMDIEGSEKAALCGARNVIMRDKPRLAICIYHNPEDLYEIPFLIKKMVPEYKLYIRHHSDTYAESVVYATL